MSLIFCHSKLTPVLGLVGLCVLISSSSFACPAAVQNARSSAVRSFNGDLCALADSTAALKKSLLAKGVQPEKMIGLRAGRFINLPDWQAANAKGNFDPRTVYEPSPSTWDSWAQAADQVDSTAIKNAQSNQLPDLTLGFLQNLNKLSLPPGANEQGGLVRGWGEEESGKALTHDMGLTESQINGLAALEYRDSQKNAIVSWEPTICLEEAPPELKQKYSGFREAPPSSELEHPGPWYVYKGEKRHCGLFHYCPTGILSAQMRGYFANVNMYLAQLRQGTGQVDPIWLAAREQRWFIAIHPFIAAGNGRTSRFAADTLIQSLGLPAPILQTDMNADIETPEAQWALEIGRGIDAAYGILSSCNHNPAGPLCQVTR